MHLGIGLKSWGSPPGLRGSPWTRRSPTRRTRGSDILNVCAIALLATPLFADGGAVLSRQESGPFVITLFAAPVPLRSGPIDLTVLVQTRDTLEPVVAAEVSIRLEGASEMRSGSQPVPGAK